MSNVLIDQLYSISFNYLEKELFENSTFYGEKLLYEADSEETRLLLAKSYIGEGKFHKAYYILKDMISPDCRYLHAQVCIKMNKFLEAEKALLTEANLKKNILSKDVENAIPNGSAGFYLLGVIAEKLNRSSDAQQLFKKSLELDPFMWCAFEKLCKLKPDKIEVGKYFSDINPKILMFNNKFMMSDNTNIQNQTNLNNTNNKSNNNPINLNQPKDFSLSPDNYNQNKNPNSNANNQIYNLNKNKAELNNLHMSNLNNNNNLNNNFSNNNQASNNNNSSSNNVNNSLFLDKNFTNKSNLRTNIPNPFTSNSNNLINNNNNNNFVNNNLNQANNNFQNTFSSSNNSVSRFNVLGQKEADESDLQSSNPSMYNKYQPEFRVFTDNSEAEKQITTPVVNKDKIETEYENMNNHQAFNPQKQNNLRPFTYSNSPNQIGQDLNKIICNSELMNNKFGNNNNNMFMSNSNNLNNLNSSNNQNNPNINNNNLEFKMKFLDSSNIKPFNFNVTSNNNTNREFTPKDLHDSNTKIDYNSNIQEQILHSGNNIVTKNVDNPNAFSGNFISNQVYNNANNSNNIFQNIQLGTNTNNDFGGNLINNNVNNSINSSTNIGNANNNNLNFSSYIQANYNNNSNISNTNKFTSNNAIFNNNNNYRFNQAANKSYETYYSIKRSEAKTDAGALTYNFNPGKFNDLGQLLKIYGEILKRLSLYKCKEAIELIEQLPINHRNSGLALGLLAKSYFELAKYKECEKYYRECLKTEPYRLEGIEYFSSCLWHLKDQYQLCNLANHVLEQSLFAPETWVVLGNNYSLQKEHEVALKFFTRAIQLNPSFAYAYTLCGHEHFSNESYIEAKNFYTKAIGIDEKHLNAWWGIAHILLKEESYDQAIVYLKKALSINSQSAILNLYLASAYQHNKDIRKALKSLDEAEKLDAKNHMIKYQKANILYYDKKYDESLKILIDLKEKIPKEAPIHVLIGHIYKSKNELNKALTHYNTALDLDPKDFNMAKASIEKLMSEYDDGNNY